MITILYKSFIISLFFLIQVTRGQPPPQFQLVRLLFFLFSFSPRASATALGSVSSIVSSVIFVDFFFKIFLLVLAILVFFSSLIILFVSKSSL